MHSYLVNLDIDFDVDLTGFSTTEIDLILENDIVPSSDDDIVLPPDSENAISQPGDIYVLNDHRVICGDTRDPEIIDRLMDGAWTARAKRR